MKGFSPCPSLRPKYHRLRHVASVYTAAYCVVHAMQNIHVKNCVVNHGMALAHYPQELSQPAMVPMLFVF
jgi:hypothetical protein